jgi:hypothetical protein
MTLSDIHTALPARRLSFPTKAIWTALCGKDIEAGHLSREDADTVLFWLITTVALFGLALAGVILFSVAHVALA